MHIVDILLRAKATDPNGLDSLQITKALYKIDVKIVYANILRDMRKLIAVGIIEKRGNLYRIKENLQLKELLETFIRPYIIDRILKRVLEYADVIDKTV